MLPKEGLTHRYLMNMSVTCYPEEYFLVLYCTTCTMRDINTVLRDRRLYWTKDMVALTLANSAII